MDRRYLLNKIEEHVLQYPNKTAVVNYNNELTYKEFYEAYNRVASNLLKLTKGENCIIPLRTSDNLKTLVSIFGILKAGAAWLPLPKEITVNKCNEILQEINTDFIITDFEEESLEKKCVLYNDLFLNNEEDVNTPSVVYDQDSICYLLYTSGSTGKPKGCVIEDKSLISRIQCLNKLFPFSEDDNYLFSTNYSFDVSITEIFGWIIGGGKVTLYNSAVEVKELPQYILDKKVTHLAFSPSYFKILYKNNEHFFRNAKYLFLAGEAFPLDLAYKILQSDTKMNVINAYGPTEATIYTTYFEVNKLTKDDTTVPIGKELDGVEILILDDGKIAPEGQIGEILIGGEGLAREYYKREEITKERFVKINGRKFYKSGDLGIKKDGLIYFKGRIDNQIKINGIRVEAEEIEFKLKKILPIEDAVVRLEKYEEKSFLVAYIKSTNAIDVSKYTLKLKAQIESYLIPKLFIQVKDFTLNKNNKVDYSLLRKEFLITMSQSGSKTNKIENIIHNKLSGIWSSLLKKEISENDDFYLVGGDSLDTVSLLIEIENIFGVNLDFDEIINNSTFNKMELLIGKKVREVDISNFKNFWNNKKNDLNFKIVFENNEKILLVNSEEEKDYILQFLDTIDNHLWPDRVIIEDFKENNEFLFDQELVIPFLANKIPSTSEFPLFSRQEFYLRKKFNSILIKELFIRERNLSQIIKSIDALINSQLMLNVVISEDKHKFVIKKIMDINKILLDEYDFSGLNYMQVQNNVDKIKKGIQSKMEHIPVFDNFLYEIIVVKENLNTYRVIFFFNHMIADGFSLNLLDREFRYITQNGALSRDNSNYRTFIEDVRNHNNDQTISEIKESSFYKELYNNQICLNSVLDVTPNAPIYEIIIENNHSDKVDRANLVFDKIAQIIEESYNSKNQSYQILKNINTYNGKDYSKEIGDFHVNIYVPFNTEREHNLYTKSEEMLKEIYIEKKWHLGYLSSSDQYMDNKDMRLFSKIKLSINYLGEFTQHDIDGWRKRLKFSRDLTNKLNSKIRITCFNYKNKSYIYFLSNAILDEKYNSFIF